MRVLAIDVGLKNLAFCYAEHPQQPQQQPQPTVNVIWWENVQVTTDVKKPSMEMLIEALTSKLTDLFAADPRFVTADAVLIENQPAIKNGAMKTVAVAIFTFFIMLKLQQGTVGSVRFMSPTSKLKCAKVPSGIAKSYAERKKAAIETVRLYLSPENKAWFDAQKKKDDLADAFLMAQYHFEHGCVWT